MKLLKELLKPKYKVLYGVFFLILTTSLFFQNCGKGFKAINFSNSDFSSTSDPFNSTTEDFLSLPPFIQNASIKSFNNLNIHQKQLSSISLQGISSGPLNSLFEINSVIYGQINDQIISTDNQFKSYQVKRLIPSQKRDNIVFVSHVKTTPFVYISYTEEGTNLQQSALWNIATDKVTKVESGNFNFLALTFKVDDGSQKIYWTATKSDGVDFFTFQMTNSEVKKIAKNFNFTNSQKNQLPQIVGSYAMVSTKATNTNQCLAIEMNTGAERIFTNSDCPTDLFFMKNRGSVIWSEQIPNTAEKQVKETNLTNLQTTNLFTASLTAIFYNDFYYAQQIVSANPAAPNAAENVVLSTNSPGNILYTSLGNGPLDYNYPLYSNSCDLNVQSNFEPQKNCIHLFIDRVTKNVSFFNGTTGLLIRQFSISAIAGDLTSSLLALSPNGENLLILQTAYINNKLMTTALHSVKTTTGAILTRNFSPKNIFLLENNSVGAVALIDGKYSFIIFDNLNEIEIVPNANFDEFLTISVYPQGKYTLAKSNSQFHKIKPDYSGSEILPNFKTLQRSLSSSFYSKTSKQIISVSTIDTENIAKISVKFLDLNLTEQSSLTVDTEFKSKIQVYLSASNSNFLAYTATTSLPGNSQLSSTLIIDLINKKAKLFNGIQQAIIQNGDLINDKNQICEFSTGNCTNHNFPADSRFYSYKDSFIVLGTTPLTFQVFKRIGTTYSAVSTLNDVSCENMPEKNTGNYFCQRYSPNSSEFIFNLDTLSEKPLGFERNYFTNLILQDGGLIRVTSQDSENHSIYRLDGGAVQSRLLTNFVGLLNIIPTNNEQKPGLIVREKISTDNFGLSILDGQTGTFLFKKNDDSTCNLDYLYISAQTSDRYQLIYCARNTFILDTQNYTSREIAWPIAPKSDLAYTCSLQWENRTLCAFSDNGVNHLYLLDLESNTTKLVAQFPFGYGIANIIGLSKTRFTANYGVIYQVPGRSWMMFQPSNSNNLEFDFVPN